MDEAQKRLLRTAKQRLDGIGDSYSQFEFDIENNATGQAYLAKAQLVLEDLISLCRPIMGGDATKKIDERMAAIVDSWLAKQKQLHRVEPFIQVTKVSGKEAPEERQARRYQMCIDSGLLMPNNDYAHLPKGVGKLAKQEGIRTASFSQDVKKHIRRINPQS
jgi:hypothetical protein